MKTCSRCQEAKQKSDFALCRRNPDGLQYRCRTCCSADHALWQQSNRENCRKRCAKHYATNKSKFNARDAVRRARKLQATPSWADLEAIRQTYTTAHTLTETSGVRHHVDHIIPLKGRNVSGLHVHWNLQVITADENLRKHNKVDHELLASGPTH